MTIQETIRMIVAGYAEVTESEITQEKNLTTDFWVDSLDSGQEGDAYCKILGATPL